MKRMLTGMSLLSLAACGTGGVVDQTVQHGVRQSTVRACTAWIPESQIALAAGVDSERLCGCAADRLLKDKSVSELADLTLSSSQLGAAVAQCVAEAQKSEKNEKGGR